MSDQAVLLPKWLPHGRNILAKGHLDHSSTFWTVANYDFSPVANFAQQSLAGQLLQKWFEICINYSFSAPIRHIIPKMRPEILVESSFQKNVQSTIRQSLLKTLNIGFEKSNQEFVWHEDTKMLIKDRTKQITLQVLYWNHATSRGR